jgi:cytoskeletal protein CcmA (bactofilin family)
MKFKRKKKFHLDTLIDENMIIRGNTTVTGGVRLDGKVYGNLMVTDGEDGTLIMGENSLIKGDVFVPTAIIGGKITGNIKCYDYLEIHANAVITGNIEYNLLEIHTGANINSNIKKMNKTEINKQKKILNEITKSKDEK